MPRYFKALATITVWILFIAGCLIILTALPLPYIHSSGSWQWPALGIASLFGAVVAMRLRKSLE
jgi:hypothetical protein